MSVDSRFSDTEHPIEQRSPYQRPPHVETGAEARQGPLGRPILYVLAGGLALGALYLIGTQIWSTTEDLPPPAQIQDEPAEAPPPAVELAPAPADAAPAPAAPAG